MGRRAQRRERAIRLAAIVTIASTSGCLGFGGPLTDSDDDAADEDSGTGGETGEPEPRCGPPIGYVDHVVDGDTIVLNSGERIRYILVNTPEITDGKNECWGTQATEHNAALVLNKALTLTYDVECEDKYGRLLAYVRVGEVEVNRVLLESGDACFLHIPPNGNGLAAEYLALEAAAKEAGVGMWGACGTIQCD